MIRDLDETVAKLLKTRAPLGSELAGAEIAFDIPDSKWRTRLTDLTVNCYLYDIRENRELRTVAPVLARSADGLRAAPVRPPVRVDCSFSITAWSVSATEPVLEEHRVLGQALLVLLQHRVIPPSCLVGAMQRQPPPFPSVVATPDTTKNLPEFWRALDQLLKPSLNYVVTLAMWPEPVPADAAMTPVVSTVGIDVAHLEELP